MTNNKDTKDLILEAATELFSKFGFAGTSIRDIASKSGVNLSAINYHFGSKQDLYWSTICNNHKYGKCKVEELSSVAQNTKELALMVFEFAITNKSLFRNTIKLYLNDGVPDPTQRFKQDIEEDFGPPGIPIFQDFLQKEVKRKLSLEELHMGSSSIFGMIFHYAMIFSSSKFDIMKEKDPYLNKSHVKSFIEHNVTSVIDYLNKNEVKLSPKK